MNDSSSVLEDVIAHGSGLPATDIPNVTPRVTVGAGYGFNCTPRPYFSAPDGYAGPYTALEVGVHGQVPDDAFEILRPYAESDDLANVGNGLAVYLQVPADIVRAVVQLLSPAIQSGTNA